MRTGMSGMTGLDARSCLVLLEGQGLNHQFGALFLPYWESGMLEAADERQSEK